MRTDIPEIIKKVGFDFDWDEKKVWVLNVPITEIDIKELIVTKLIHDKIY